MANKKVTGSKCPYCGNGVVPTIRIRKAVLSCSNMYTPMIVTYPEHKRGK